MPPGSQVLDARVAGYVVEAAIPRFISREGTLTENDWAVEDRLVNDNGSMLTHKSDNGGMMIDRDLEKPLFGPRTDSK